MKNISTGAGLAVLGLGVAVHPLLSGLASSATASASTAPAAAAIASATAAQAEPTVVWFGASAVVAPQICYHRLWSDGRLERRQIQFASSGNMGSGPGGCSYQESGVCSDSGWVEVPPPPGGDGITCRTDLNGDGAIGSADLSRLLNEWGQNAGCEATYPCLDLGNLAGGVAAK